MHCPGFWAHPRHKFATRVPPEDQSNQAEKIHEKSHTNSITIKQNFDYNHYDKLRREYLEYTLTKVSCPH